MDKRPKTKAPLLKMASVLFNAIGNFISKKLMLPSIKQATIKGLVIIDLIKLNIDVII